MLALRPSPRLALARNARRPGARQQACRAVAAAARPTSEECARTLVDIADRGTLSSLTEDGWPLGTHAAFLLDAQGQPLLRLRASAAATLHLIKDARCSLYVQPNSQPLGVLSRATLLGRVEPLGEEALSETWGRFAETHRSRTGVDALQEGDLYFRLLVERVFFVGGLGSDTRAETVSGDAYRAAQPDPLRRLAPLLVRQMNEDRLDDVARFCEAAGVEDAAAVSFLSVDYLGFDVRALLRDGTVRDVRVPFTRPVQKEQDAISQLTLLAQQQWESAPAGKSYKPQEVAPATV